MDKFREMIRLHELARNQTEIARGCGAARSTVQDYLRRALAPKLTYAQVQQLSDSDIQALLGKGKRTSPSTDEPIAFDIIHRELSGKMGERTIYTYLSHPTFPEWQPTVHRRRRGSQLDDYKPYLNQQWEQGRHSSKALFEDIQQQGYPGSYMSVTRYTRKLRQLKRDELHTLPGLGASPSLNSLEPKPLSARRAAWLVLQRIANLTMDEEKLLEQLCQHSELSPSISLTQRFLHLVRQRLPHQLDDWIEEAENISIKSLQSFAQGLKDDYDAVKAGITLEVSNGQVEGQNNRLKMLKRQMFRRAGLDLLAKRLILKE